MVTAESNHDPPDPHIIALSYYKITGVLHFTALYCPLSLHSPSPNCHYQMFSTLVFTYMLA